MELWMSLLAVRPAITGPGVFLACLFGLAPAAQTEAASERLSPVRVVTDQNFPPYIVKHEDGSVEGYIVDLWRLWERKTGIRVDLNAMQWSEAQKRLLAGEADVIDMIYRTPTRAPLLDFSHPYASSSIGIYVDASIQGVNDARALQGYTVGVQRGDACIEKLTELEIKNLKLYPNYAAILADANAGTVKIFCMDDEPASFYLHRDRGKARIYRAFELYAGAFHWAVIRGDTATFDLVDRGMQLITAQERQALREKWFRYPFAFRPFLRITLIGITVSLVLLAAAGLWIWSLRRAVKHSTAQLTKTNHQLQRAAKALRDEKALLRTIIEHSPDALILKDAQGICVAANAAAQRLFDPANELATGCDQRFDNPANTASKHVAGHSERYVALFHTKTSPTEFDDSEREFEVTTIPITDAQGGPVRSLTIAHDVTDMRRTERELRIAAAAFDSYDGQIVTDKNGVIERVNSGFVRISGYSAKESIGRSPSFLKSNLHSQDFYDGIWSALNTDGHWYGELVNRHRDGHVYSARLSISAVYDENGTTIHYIGNLQDITAEKEALSLVRHLKLYDTLTDLPNRLLIEDHIRQTLSKSGPLRENGAVMMFDLDFFRQINDSLGHAYGDHVLAEVAARVRSVTRDGDMLSRFSGDSFLLVAHNLATDKHEAAAEARILGESIRQSVQFPIVVANQRLSCTVSIGIALYCDREVTLDALLRQAELAMYKSKSQGRNTLHFFEDNMQIEIDLCRQLKGELQEALEQHQFALYYQVQVDANGYPIGAEALLRWLHPTRGLVPPTEFIPIAEETGLIEPIGRWALEAACWQLAQWARDEALEHLTLAVNVSPRQFKSAHFVKDVLSNLERAGAPAEKLKLEVTESLAIDDFEDSIAKLRKLRESGLQISLDDFGTGNSSLNYLTKLPLTQLKIDKSFVDHLPESRPDATVAQTIIAMGRGLELDVIAEGVENRSQRDFLVRHGCIAFQGYLFGRPMPAREFDKNITELLSSHHKNKAPPPKPKHLAS